MDLQQLQTQQLHLLAQKALKLDEIKGIEVALGQIAAIQKFAEENPPAPEPDPE